MNIKSAKKYQTENLVNPNQKKSAKVLSRDKNQAIFKNNHFLRLLLIYIVYKKDNLGNPFYEKILLSENLLNYLCKICKAFFTICSALFRSRLDWRQAKLQLAVRGPSFNFRDSVPSCPRFPPIHGSRHVNSWI